MVIYPACFIDNCYCGTGFILAAYDISAERKSLYNDIENLRVYGLDVIGTQEDRTLFLSYREQTV